MSLRAKCKQCSWKARADGSVYLHLAMEAHRRTTGHTVKMKEK